MLYRIIAVMWAAVSMIIFMDYADLFPEMTIGNEIICFVIIIVGAPIFLANNILTYILDLFMPEGWDQ